MHMENAPLLIDFQLNEILKNKNNVKTPSEKSKMVKDILPIFAEIQNKIIRSEYVKMVASTLNIDEASIQSEVNKIDNSSSYQSSRAIAPTIVTKTSSIDDKAQQNLLSLYIVNESPISAQQMKEMIDVIEFSNEKLIIVKTTIDKLTCTVNNTKALIEQLYTEFVQDEELKAIITDLIGISETFNNLSAKDFMAIIDENITRIKQCRGEAEKTEMKKMYKNVNDDENEALKIQMQLRDKINNRLRTGDN